MYEVEYRPLLIYFLILNIAQNQSFAQKEVGQNMYFLKRTSISLFRADTGPAPTNFINVTLLLFK